MSERTKISATVFTYNQEDTIRQCIDSILMQKGNFDMEIVIAEDCSTDHTWDICKEYADKYPNLIRLLPNTHNLGIFPNWIRMVKACTGDFISGLAGDDYWCDEYKLKKQVQFLLAHPDYGFVTTDAYRYYVRRNKMVSGIAPAFDAPDGIVKSFYFNPGYQGGVYVMPITQMIRRELLDLVDFDEMLRRKLPVEDYPMQAIWSQHTKFGHIPNEITSVYRVYDKSASFISVDHPKYLEYHRGLMETRRYLNELFPQDACFTEEMMADYIFYKEFLLYLHKLQYKKAKQLLAENETKLANQPHYKQAKRMCGNIFVFLAFRLYKEMNYKLNIRKRT